MNDNDDHVGVGVIEWGGTKGSSLSDTHPRYFDVRHFAGVVAVRVVVTF